MITAIPECEHIGRQVAAGDWNGERALIRLVAAAVREDRRRIAEFVGKFGDDDMDHMARSALLECAEAIRAMR